MVSGLTNFLTNIDLESYTYFIFFWGGVGIISAVGDAHSFNVFVDDIFLYQRVPSWLLFRCAKKLSMGMVI